MTQEKLALMSHVTTRTVQRAEGGEAINLETLADLAAALGVPPESLRTGGDDQENDESTLPGEVVALRRTLSGRQLLDALDQAELSRLDCDVEPTRENIDLLKRLVAKIELHQPSHPWSPYQGRGTLSLSDRLDALVVLNDYIAALGEVGVGLFVGNHVISAIMPIYSSDDEPHVRRGQPPQPVRAVRLLLASSSLDKLTVSAATEWGVEIHRPPETFDDFLMEEP
jgi:transcriptional regulator with XRE-family HTH domain